MRKVNLFDISNKVIIITGGSGILGGNMANYLISVGAKIVVLGLTHKSVKKRVTELKKININATGFSGNVLDRRYLEKVRDEILKRWGKIDVLINAAGGIISSATIGKDQTIFDLKMEDFKKESELNLDGTVLPSIVFGEVI